MSGITAAWSEKLAEYVAAVEACQTEQRISTLPWGLSEAFTKEFLVKDYPVLLGNVRCGVSIQPGWASLVHDLCSDITMVMAANPTLKVRVDQVKQKLGSLRFYAMAYTSLEEKDGHLFNFKVEPQLEDAKNHINRLIANAENASAYICEVCGQPGKIINSSGYLRASCERHAHK